MDLKDQAASLSSASIRKDSKLNVLEINLLQKSQELEQKELVLKKVQEEREEANSLELAKKSQAVEAEATRLRDETERAQSEVDRLLTILKEMEFEKTEKSVRIQELEGQLKDSSKKLSTLKRDQQIQKKKTAQMFEEARKREGNLSTDTASLQEKIKKKDDRIEELEEALRESVSITADRELMLEQNQKHLGLADKQISESTSVIERLKRNLADSEMKFGNLRQQLKEKETNLFILQNERKKHLEEALEMKQEALLSAISEKDANIGFLEQSKNPKNGDEVKRLKKEKEHLVQQLNDLTHRRMKLVHHQGNGKSKSGPKKEPHPPAQQLTPSPEQIK